MSASGPSGPLVVACDKDSSTGFRPVNRVVVKYKTFT